MLNLLLQATPTAPTETFFGRNPGSGALIAAGVAFIVGMAIYMAMTQAPTRLRRPLVWFFTFLAGGYYVAFWLWPKPIDRQPGQIPNDFVENVGFILSDAQGRVAVVANVITAFLLGLGIFSLLRIHVSRLAKKQKDWFFSALLLVSLLAMVIVGYIDWRTFQNDTESKLQTMENWTTVNYAKDLLFDGMLQNMDAVMFSMIAFFILSAAYRAFRIRSIEASVLMASALIAMLNLLGLVDYAINSAIDAATGGDPTSILNNLRLSEAARWVQSTMQVPAIRALEFGVGLGALAMGLRLWLGLEKGGVN